MKVTIGEEGLSKTWQEDFPATTNCVYCGGESRVGFVAHEAMDRDDQPVWPRNYIQYVTDLHDNTIEGYWLHDCAAVAVYFCKECLETTALYNQA